MSGSCKKVFHDAKEEAFPHGTKISALLWYLGGGCVRDELQVNNSHRCVRAFYAFLGFGYFFLNHSLEPEAASDCLEL